MMSEAFGRERKLTRRVEFLQIYSQGQSYGTRWFVCHVLETGPSDRPARLGITASRQTGPAHDRNRYKRWAREVFRRENVRPGVDLVVRFRPAIESAEFGQFRSALLKVLDRAGLRNAQSQEKSDT